MSVSSALVLLLITPVILGQGYHHPSGSSYDHVESYNTLEEGNNVHYADVPYYYHPAPPPLPPPVPAPPPPSPAEEEVEYEEEEEDEEEEEEEEEQPKQVPTPAPSTTEMTPTTTLPPFTIADIRVPAPFLRIETMMCFTILGALYGFGFLVLFQSLCVPAAKLAVYVTYIALLKLGVVNPVTLEMALEQLPPT